MAPLPVGKAEQGGKLIYPPNERWSPMQKSSDSNDLNGGGAGERKLEKADCESKP